MDVGYGRVPNLITEGEVQSLMTQLPTIDGQAGTRSLLDHGWCRALALDPRLLGLATQLLGAEPRPVRAILFDKVPGRNWNLGWHQDTKIAVREARPELAGFSGWSEKEGVVHVLPPVEILESCVALRLHLDPCPASNGPLQVIPNSHRLGLRTEVSDEEISRAETLIAEAGDVVWMRPLVFHGSPRSEVADHRRVVHIEYCAAELPAGLEWAW